MNRNGKFAVMLGEAAEYAVAAQLLVRGTVPLWPSIDSGYDLATEAGCRIQVKGSRVDGVTREGEPIYWFPLASRWHKRPLSASCDIVVLWGADQNRFWIIPARICGNLQALQLGGPDPERYAGSISDMREMRSLGYTYAAIGKKFGLNKSSAKQFIDSGRDFVSETAVSQVRVCENAWQSIKNFTREPSASVQSPTELISHVEEAL